MHNSLSLETLLNIARTQVNVWGRIGATATAKLEAFGVNVGALESRLIALKEPA